MAGCSSKVTGVTKHRNLFNSWLLFYFIYSKFDMYVVFSIEYFLQLLYIFDQKFEQPYSEFIFKILIDFSCICSVKYLFKCWLKVIIMTTSKQNTQYKFISRQYGEWSIFTLFVWKSNTFVRKGCCQKQDIFLKHALQIIIHKQRKRYNFLIKKW